MTQNEFQKMQTWGLGKRLFRGHPEGLHHLDFAVIFWPSFLSQAILFDALPRSIHWLEILKNQSELKLGVSEDFGFPNVNIGFPDVYIPVFHGTKEA
jgi:hypothetical protein